MCVATRGFHNTQLFPGGYLITGFPAPRCSEEPDHIVSHMENKSAVTKPLARVPALEFFGLHPELKSRLFQWARSGEEFEGQPSSYKRQDTKRDVYHGSP